jgi:hypothetical protein
MLLHSSPDPRWKMQHINLTTQTQPLVSHSGGVPGSTRALVVCPAGCVPHTTQHSMTQHSQAFHSLPGATEQQASPLAHTGHTHSAPAALVALRDGVTSAHTRTHTHAYTPAACRTAPLRALPHGVWLRCSECEAAAALAAAQQRGSNDHQPRQQHWARTRGGRCRPHAAAAAATRWPPRCPRGRLGLLLAAALLGHAGVLRWWQGVGVWGQAVKHYLQRDTAREQAR